MRFIWVYMGGYHYDTTMFTVLKSEAGITVLILLMCTQYTRTTTPGAVGT